MSIAGHWYAYSILSALVHFTAEADIYESASGPMVEICEIVGIGAVIGQAHVIPSGERQWIVNHRIDLQTFNDIY